MTELQQALINAGVSSMTFRNKNLVESITLAVYDMPDTSLVRLFHAGHLQFGDAVNSHTGSEGKAAFAIALVEKYRTGNFARTGSTADPIRAAFYGIIANAYRKHGLATSDKEALKLARDGDYDTLAESLLIGEQVEATPEAILLRVDKLQENAQAAATKIAALQAESISL